MLRKHGKTYKTRGDNCVSFYTIQFGYSANISELYVTILILNNKTVKYNELIYVRKSCILYLHEYIEQNH